MAWTTLSVRKHRNHAMSPVSAYPAQHPGVPSPRATASVGMHLIRLHLLLERGLRPENANAAIVRASRRNRDFTWLDPPPPSASSRSCTSWTRAAPKSTYGTSASGRGRFGMRGRPTTRPYDAGSPHRHRRCSSREVECVARGSEDTLGRSRAARRPRDLEVRIRARLIGSLP